MMTFIDHYEALFYWFMWASIIGFIVSLILIPWMIIQLPSDYFLHGKRKKHQEKKESSLVKMVILLIRNIVGIIFIISGIIMLFIPGQGLLTIIMGIIFTDLPYKYKIEQWIIHKPKVLNVINKLRIKAKQNPFEINEIKP